MRRAELAQVAPGVDARIVPIAKTNAHRVMTDGLDGFDSQRSRGSARRHHREGIALHFRTKLAHISTRRMAAQQRNRQCVLHDFIPVNREPLRAINIKVARWCIRLRWLHRAMLRSSAMRMFDLETLACDALTPAIRAKSLLPEHGVYARAHRVQCDETSALVPHANNIAILGWIDQLAEHHGHAAGASRETLAREGRMWFVASHTINYLGESFVDDELILATWIEKLGRTSLTRTTVISRRDDGTPVVRAESRWALVDLSTRKPIAISEAIRAALLS